MLIRCAALVGLAFTFISCAKDAPPEKDEPVVIAQPGFELASAPFGTEVMEAYVAQSPAPVVIDGVHFLSYELTIANNVRTPFKLASIEVIDPKNPGTPVAVMASDYLAENVLRHGQRPIAGNLTMEGNQFGIANLRYSVPIDKTPQQVFHRLNFELSGRDGGVRTFPFELARMTIAQPTSRVLDFPFGPGLWFHNTAGHINTRTLTEGRPTYAQRYAIDWAMAQDDGKFMRDSGDNNVDYPTYDVPLLAVADGVVIAVKDGIVENVPGDGEFAVKIDRDTVAGNFVMMNIGGGANAVYAHLIPGSVAVKVGDRVSKGDEIGRLGNSGNSDAPHLHFHLETVTGLARPLAGEGIPYHFASFDQVAKYEEDQMATIFDGDTFPLETRADTRTLEMPYGNGVIRVR